MTRYHTIAEATAALRAGETTSVELLSESFEVIEKHNDTLGMYLTMFKDQAMEAAASIDADLERGKNPGALAGIPLGIKDIISTVEGDTTAQSLVMDRQWGREYGDATVIERLRRAGGVITGKLTTMEFAIGMPDHQQSFPLPRNPWNPDHWTGGSSSGSGSAVATGAVLGALGSDTAGSVRMPATFCGITGLMGTYGRVPKAGCAPLGYTLDRIGPMARTAQDCALLLQEMAGYHSSDPSTLDVPTENYMKDLTGDLTGVTIGVDSLTWTTENPEDPAVIPAFESALESLAARGAKLVELRLPYFLEMGAANYLVLAAEALAYHGTDLRNRWDDYGRGTRMIIGSGALYSSADYVQVQRARRVAKKALSRLFDQVDLIVTPSTGQPAPAYANIKVENQLQTFSNNADRRYYLGYWNFMGNPVISVPMGFTEASLPLGLQLAGRPFEESLVLRAADAYQQETDWHLRRPPLL